MAIAQDVIRKLTVVATETGLTSVQQKLTAVAKSQDEVTASSSRMATATAAVEARTKALLSQFNGAGGVAGIAGKAGTDFIAPAVASMARFVPAILAAVAAWKTLNYVIDLGQKLIEQYGNANEKRFGSNLQANLEALTKYQQGTLSASQAQNASTIADRQQAAREEIERILKLHFDLIDVALKFQGAWAGVLEIIARVLALAAELPAAVPAWARAAAGGALSGLPYVGAGITAYRAVNALAGSAPEMNSEQALAAARANLSAGLGNRASGVGTFDANGQINDKGQGINIGGTFAAHFSDAISQINKAQALPQDKDEKDVRNAYTRALDSVSKNIALTEAQTKAVDAGAGAQAKYRVEAELTEAALRAKLNPASKEIADTIKQMGERAAVAAQQLAELKLKSDLTFERSQLGRDPIEATVASKLRGVYGADYINQMDGSIAAQIRLNEQLKQTKDLATDFASGFVRDLANGAKPIDALTNAMARLRDKLLDIAVNKAITSFFGSSGLDKLFTSSSPFAGPVGQSSVVGPLQSANGNAFYGGNVIPFARGGVVSSPTIFPMANGAGLMGEAGPEAVMPLHRGSDGSLGVRSAAGGPTVVNNVIIQNQTNGQVEQQQQKNSSGGTDTIVLIRQAVVDTLAGGHADPAMKSRFGVTPSRRAR